MSFVAADMVVGHEAADDNAESAGDEESEGESDLFDGRLVVDCVRVHHHHVFVCYRKRVIHIRHGWFSDWFVLCSENWIWILGFRNLGI